ncbi:hypothetical protein [Pelagicoccus sp. SDUM812003]|uniref:hypothetical protein n=1 Tax=Pelagicoccus sp. SDUM812003 TaxID=3041267 RepID=UPI00280EBBD2|nr:hypothetical protein [Pelagicoccus sp. SDUM812003]MDQ8205757.1 hypothetical protein [Pelagicoccus sp. SDUM812003]
MKNLISVLFCFLATACAVGNDQEEKSGHSKLSEEEISNLPEGCFLKDIQDSLGYFTRAGVAVPLISFRNQTNEYILIFDSDDGRVLAIFRVTDSKEDVGDELLIWPESLKGKSIGEILANQSAHTTPASAPR